MKTKLKNPPKQRNRKPTKEVTRGTNAICQAAKKAAFQVKHNKDCELGDNYKDCPACQESEI